MKEISRVPEDLHDELFYEKEIDDMYDEREAEMVEEELQRLRATFSMPFLAQVLLRWWNNSAEGEGGPISSEPDRSVPEPFAATM